MAYSVKPSLGSITPKPVVLPNLPVVGVKPIVGGGTLPPVLISHLRLVDIKAGSVLTITTENHTYTINVNGPSTGMLMTNNGEVKNGLIILHGAWDVDRGSALWGFLERGKGFLFAHQPNPKDGTKTSAIMKMTLASKRA